MDVLSYQLLYAAFAATQVLELVHISEHAEWCASKAAGRQHEDYLAFSL